MRKSFLNSLFNLSASQAVTSRHKPSQAVTSRHKPSQYRVGIAKFLGISTAIFSFVSSQQQPLFAQAPPVDSNYDEHILYNFGDAEEDATFPVAALIIDSAGNLFGTSTGGGGGAADSGTAFELVNNGDGTYTQTILHSFGSTPTDGVAPSAALIMDSKGNLFGTTPSGGANSNKGTAFELVNNGDGTYTETILHNFGDPNIPDDGATPQAALIMDGGGNLFGTTAGGGAHSSGTAFKLANNGDGTYTETILYSFGDPNISDDGAIPQAALIMDGGGNLFGTTVGGGANNSGTAFKLANNGDGTYTETILHSFGSTPTDGVAPSASLIMDSGGNLFGTTTGGGTNNSGTAFKLANNGDGTYTETILYSFGDPNISDDGAIPRAALIMDGGGNLFGTTAGGGTNNSGTAFGLTNNGDGTYTETILHSFGATDSDGQFPYAALIIDPATSNLLGTTVGGGTHTFGTVFELFTSPIITSSLTENGTTGSPFTYQITATGSPTSFGAAPLPAGLHFDSTTGVITGTPTESGVFHIELSATNSVGTGTATLTLTILIPTPTPTAIPTPSPSSIPSVTPTSTPSQQSVVSVLAQNKHFTLIRTGGDLSQELQVFFNIKTKEINFVANNDVNKTRSHNAQTRFKAGETTTRIRLKKLKKLVDNTPNQGLKVVLRLLPSPSSSTEIHSAKLYNAYEINSEHARAKLILPPTSFVPIQPFCSPLFIPFLSQ